MSSNHDADESAASVPDCQLRLLPALMIVATMWAILILPGWYAPLTKLHFMSMQLGPVVGAIGLSIWWIVSRAMPIRKRLTGVAMMFALFAIAMMFMHPSMRIIMLVKGLPMAITLMVGGFLLGWSAGLPKQGWIGLIAFAVLMLGATLTRSENMDADFQFDMVSRWKPTAEDELLVAMKKPNDQSQSEVTTTLVLPDEPATTDWGEFRGPNRDSILTGVTFKTNWENQPPPERWRKPIGPGWSSFCVVGPLFFTQEQRGEQELVTAYQVSDGELVWTNQTDSRFEASMGGIGPRATPTYRDQQLYVTGASGLVQCLNAKSGVPIWQFDLIEELEVPMPAWGFSSSPLVLDKLAIVFAGGGEENAMVALDRKTGKIVWSIGSGSHGYSSPQLSNIDGVQQVLISSNRGVQSVTPDEGELLWRHEWDIGEMARVTQPTVVGNTVYLGTGYGGGTMKIDLTHEGDTWSTEEVWIESMKPYFNDCVFHDGYLYGFDGPIFMCRDADSGDKAWKKGRYGHGQVLLIKDMETLLITTEKGDLVLAKADPKRLNEIVKIKSVDGITWNHPVIAQGKLFVRNAQEMVCYDLSGM